ncbi:MAG: T9SS type A sorting domain-containing protein [Candidatus Zixiibacteriota bacterium]|nr:MAG: T9SS type A sorting domain-containing protein [candidate division Zixibacteria bacterium]
MMTRKSLAILLAIAVMAMSVTWVAAQQDSVQKPQEKKLSFEERLQYLGLEIPDEVKKRFEDLDKLPPPVLLNTEDFFDWRMMGGVTPVKDQGDCGSCWAFAATGAFESAVLIADSIEWDLSEQQALSCNTGESSCEGGWMEDAFAVFMGYGAVGEACMPYQADDTVPCTQEQCVPLARQIGFEDIPNNISAIKNALLSGPVSTTFMVYSDFQYNCYWHDPTDEINHAVVIVGWDDVMCGGLGAWIVKNSWGVDHGDSGYDYIPYNSCGIGRYTQRPIYADGAPILSYSPDSISLSVSQNGSASRTVEISNLGAGNLNYHLDAVQSVQQDSFGYFWFDSDSSQGPQYGWIDISSIGQVIDFGVDIDDGNSGPLDLGFSFNFYGNDFNSICVCTNGWASFTDSVSVEYGNVAIPDPEPPNNMLAVFYDDMNFENGGTGYFYTNNSDSAIITWQDVPDWRQEGIFTFQIILVAPMSVTYQYEEMGPGRLSECSIGIENGDGTIGLEVIRDTTYMHNFMAVDFNWEPLPVPLTWVSIDEGVGVVLPNQTAFVDVVFSGDGLSIGTYDAKLRLASNDPNNTVNDIPVIMEVVEQTVISGNAGNLPAGFSLSQNYPNPFNAATIIGYDLSLPAHVELGIYNILGRKMITLINEFQQAGKHHVTWNAEEMASGFYFYKIQAGDYSETKRMLLLK